MVADSPREEFSDRLIADPPLGWGMCDHRPDDGDGPSPADRHRGRHVRAAGRQDRLGELLAGLARRRRREVLYYLLEHELADLETIATRIARMEREGDPERIRTDLVHTHLPKLADRGLIEYDRRSGAIRLTDPGDRLVALLEQCRALESEQ